MSNPRRITARIGHMARQFGTTPHSEIAHAFEAENRVHTFVEQLGEGYTKKYQLRVSLEELLTLLDALSFVWGMDTATNAMAGKVKSHPSTLATRQLRVKILQTLGITEEG